MSITKELLRQGRHGELWQICCGFLDLSLDQFMSIQEQLLLEQIELLKRCKLGRKVMQGAMPETIEEFRAQVPLTSYADYCPELLEKQEEILPVKPDRWIQTSGRSGEYPCKWIPVTRRFWDEAGLNFGAVAILGTCHQRGEIVFKEGFTLLHAMAHPPYLTGNVAAKLKEDLGFKFLPPISESTDIPFEDRVDKGFNMAMSNGMDGFFGLAGVLVAIGEKFRQGSGSTRITKLLLHPKKLLRLARGKIKSRRAGRPMLPKDLWSLKVIASMGTDSAIYKEKIKDLWGRSPLDVYGNTETTIIATQTWDYNYMTFFPNLNFLEFIPENEHFKSQLDPSYQPKTVLLNEVKAGENYELVITNFHGGALVRYRIGDMIKIKSLQNEKLGIDIPQMVFERRADDLIDLGFMRLTEKVIWQALENSNIPYKEWTARKEFGQKEVGKTPKLHIYVEPRDGNVASEKSIAKTIYEEIKQIDDGLYVYNDLASLERLIDFNPIDVTILPKGVFANYKEQRKAEGARLAHQKPPHINPSDDILTMLCPEFETTAEEVDTVRIKTKTR